MKEMSLQGKMLTKTAKRRCCSWRNIFGSIFLSVILLHVLCSTRSDVSSFPWRSFLSSDLSGQTIQKIIPPQRKSLFTSIIVMSSNPRTGSSYTGELLSASSDSAYFFEPLWYYVDNKHSKSPTFEDKKSLLLNLLKCNFHDPRLKKILLSKRQSTFVFRKPSIAGLKYDKSRLGRIGFLKRMEIKCKMTKTRVIKTIRMSMSEMLHFISQLPEEGRVSRKSFHVIYLARDPRGIINSVKSLEEQWPDSFLEPQHICSRMLTDTVTLQNCSEPNLMVLKYEDIVHKPEEQLISISKRFNVSLIGQVENFIQSHNSARWKGNSKQMNNSSKSSPESQNGEENPLKGIVEDIAKQIDFEKDTNILEGAKNDDKQKEDEELIDLEEGSSEADPGTDYYDSNGKIMTVRKKRSLLGHMTNLFNKKTFNKIRKVKGVEADPEGRSYYYSTYRKPEFDPDHWKTSLSEDLLNKILGEEMCLKVIQNYDYKV